MTVAAAACKLARMDIAQETTRRFITELLRATGWSPTELAKKSGIAHTTLTRFLNSEEVGHTLSTRTLGKIREAAATTIPREQIDHLWLLSQRSPPAERRGRGRNRASD